MRLSELAYARSGDKGDNPNIGVIARAPMAYETLRTRLTAALVRDFLKEFGAQSVERYELPNLGALNFVVHSVLDGGGSVSLRIDPQGRALAQALLEMELDISEPVAEAQSVQPAAARKIAPSQPIPRPIQSEVSAPADP